MDVVPHIVLRLAAVLYTENLRWLTSRSSLLLLPL